MAQFIVRIEPMLLVAVAPFLLLAREAFAPMLFVIPALWLCRRRATGHYLPSTPLNAPLLLLWLMIAVSLYASYDLRISYPRIAGLALGLGVFAAVAAQARTPARWGAALGLYLLGGAGLAGLALLGTDWLHKFPFLDPVLERLPPRLSEFVGPEGTFHPNIVAGALTWVLPAALILSGAGLFRQEWLPPPLRRWPLQSRGGLVVVSMVTAAVFILVQSRGAYLGLLATLAGLGLLSLVWIVRRGSRRARALSLGAVALLVVGLFAPRGAWLPAAEQALFASGSTGIGRSAVDSLASRAELWSRALYAVQDFPITGLGLGTFQSIVNLLYPLFTVSSETDFVHPHNHWLAAAVEVGLPGLVAYLAIWMGAAWMLLRIWVRTPQGWTRPAALALAGSLMAYNVYGMTDAIALGTKPGVVWWYLLGLIAALYNGAAGGAAWDVQADRQGPASAGDRIA